MNGIKRKVLKENNLTFLNVNVNVDVSSYNSGKE